MTTQSAPLSELAHSLLLAAEKAGAEACDCVVIKSETRSIEVRNGALETAESSDSIDLGLRVFVGKRQAVVSVSDKASRTQEQMAERAVAMAKLAPEDPFAGLPEPEQMGSAVDAHSLEIVDTEPQPGAQRLEDMAKAADAAALGIKGVSKSDGSSAFASRADIHLAASTGFSAGYARSVTQTSSVVISGEGLEMERDYAFESRVFAADLPAPEEIGALAGARAVARAGARKPPTGTYPVLYDERIASSLIGHLLAAVNGQSVARGASWLRDAMGEQVLPKGLSIREDQLRPRVRGSRPFDDEGLPSRASDIVRDGVLERWVLDLATARQLGLESTANAVRSVSRAPSPSASNIALTQGDKSRDALLRDMGTGLLITSMIGSTINPTTGDYSRGASGFWVENGEITHPVNECTVAGNLRDMLKRIIPANDAQTHMSRVVPSLLVEGMTIAGA